MEYLPIGRPCQRRFRRSCSTSRRPLRRAHRTRRWWPAGTTCPPPARRWWPAGAPRHGYCEHLCSGKHDDSNKQHNGEYDLSGEYGKHQDEHFWEPLDYSEHNQHNGEHGNHNDDHNDSGEQNDSGEHFGEPLDYNEHKHFGDDSVEHYNGEPAEHTEKKPCFDCGNPALLVRVRRKLSCSECERFSHLFFFCEEGCRAMLCRRCTCAAGVETNP